MSESEYKGKRLHKWRPTLSDAPAIAFFIAIAVITVIMAGQFPLAPRLMAAIVTSAACVGAYGVLASLVSMNSGRKLMVIASSLVLVVSAVLLWPTPPAPIIAAEPSATVSAGHGAPQSIPATEPPTAVPSISASKNKMAATSPIVPSRSPAAPAGSKPSTFQFRISPTTVAYGQYFTISGTGTPVNQSPEDTSIHVYLDQDVDEREIAWPHPANDGSFSVRIKIESDGTVQPVDRDKYPPIALDSGGHKIVAWVWDGHQTVRMTTDPVLMVTS